MIDYQAQPLNSLFVVHPIFVILTAVINVSNDEDEGEGEDESNMGEYFGEVAICTALY